MATAPEGG